MTDLIIDTNSICILADDDIVQTIFNNNDVVYVPRCVWRKQIPIIYTRYYPLHLLLKVRDVTKELEKKGLFYVINPRKAIPAKLENNLIKEGADDCDRDLVKLCLDRREKGDVVIITTDVNHFQNIRKLRPLCIMKTPDEYWAM